MDFELALKDVADGDGERRLNTKGTGQGDLAGQRLGNRKGCKPAEDQLRAS